jgi:two-component system chemotaxis sensor kinase CheA
MARSLGKQLNKKIDVHISGEDTEVDKSLVEDLDSPLTHMIRNVADHAIDLPSDRLARGVSETGNLWLRAEKTRTHIVVTVQDDGRGIDPNRLRDKAVEKGLHDRASADAISDQEAIELIFHAGLSTAEVVSDVSGRGVGLDVVRTKLAEHDGRLTVESQIGVGTTFRLEIPIRKAVMVIDGLMVRQNGELFVLPSEYVREITQIAPSDLNYVQNSPMASVRGSTFLAPCLGDLLELPPPPDTDMQTRPGVLVGCKLGDACLRVDEVVGHRQIVVNSISEAIGAVDHIAGVAQLGAGRLALVLSIPDLTRLPQLLT